MSAFDSSQGAGYCDSCREQLLSEIEVHTITTKLPGSGMMNMFQKPKGYRLCKKCFVSISNDLEKMVMTK